MTSNKTSLLVNNTLHFQNLELPIEKIPVIDPDMPFVKAHPSFLIEMH